MLKNRYLVAKINVSTRHHHSQDLDKLADISYADFDFITRLESIQTPCTFSISLNDPGSDKIVVTTNKEICREQIIKSIYFSNSTCTSTPVLIFLQGITYSPEFIKHTKKKIDLTHRHLRDGE